MNSGIPDVMVCREKSTYHCHIEDSFGYYNGSIAHYVGLVINEPLLSPPGGEFDYSNPSFVLAAYLIEKLSGRSLQEYFQKNLFDPVGLKDTYYDPYESENRVIKNEVSQYVKYYDGQTGTNGICKWRVLTVDDLTRWYLDLLGNYGKSSKVLTEESIQQIIQPLVYIPIDLQIGEFFGQGVTVTYSNGSHWPDDITYCGSTLCTYTCIQMKTGRSGDTLISAAFSNINYAIANNSAA